MKIALIGCGYWGGIVAKVLMRKQALLSVYDVNPDKAQEMAHTHKVAIKSLEALARCDECTGLYIAVPFGFRGDLVETALQTGKTVLVEKPLHRTFEGAQGLMAYARKHGTRLHAGHLLRYHPTIARLQQFFKAAQDRGDRGDKGHRGRVKEVAIRRFGKGRAYEHQDVLMDFTIHDVSVAQSLLGPLCPQIERLEVRGQGTPMHHIAIECRLANGVVLRIEDDNRSEEASRTTLIGLEDGRLTIDEKTGENLFAYNDGRQINDPLSDYPAPQGETVGDELGIMVQRVFGGDGYGQGAYNAESQLTEDAYKFTQTVRNQLETTL